MSNEERLAEMLNLVFDESCNVARADTEECRNQFVFHLLDWKDELRKLAELYASPERFSSEEARKIVQAFLYHGASHIVAAARLGGFFLDAFGTSSEKDERKDS